MYYCSPILPNWISNGPNALAFRVIFDVAREFVCRNPTSTHCPSLPRKFHRRIQFSTVPAPKTKRSRAPTKTEIRNHLTIDERKYLEIHRDAKKLLKELYNDSRCLDNYNLWDKEKIAHIQACLVRKHPLLSQCEDDWGSWHFVYKVWNAHRTAYVSCMF